MALLTPAILAGRDAVKGSFDLSQRLPLGHDSPGQPGDTRPGRPCLASRPRWRPGQAAGGSVVVGN
jgi:hypothetical protein